MTETNPTIASLNNATPGVPQTLDDVANRAAFPDPVPTVDLTPAQRERAIDIIAEMHATFSEKVRELAADELADLLGIDRAAWRDKWTELVMEQMRSTAAVAAEVTGRPLPAGFVDNDHDGHG